MSAADCPFDVLPNMVISNVMGRIPLKDNRMDVCADHPPQLNCIPLALHPAEEIQDYFAFAGTAPAWRFFFGGASGGGFAAAADAR